MERFFLDTFFASRSIYDRDAPSFFCVLVDSTVERPTACLCGYVCLWGFFVFGIGFGSCIPSPTPTGIPHPTTRGRRPSRSPARTFSHGIDTRHGTERRARRRASGGEIRLARQHVDVVCRARSARSERGAEDHHHRGARRCVVRGIEFPRRTGRRVGGWGPEPASACGGGAWSGTPLRVHECESVSPAINVRCEVRATAVTPRPRISTPRCILGFPPQQVLKCELPHLINIATDLTNLKRRRYRWQANLMPDSDLINLKQGRFGRQVTNTPSFPPMCFQDGTETRTQCSSDVIQWRKSPRVWHFQPAPYAGYL